MFKKLVPVNKDVHANFKVKPLDGFGFAKDFHIASIMVHEFAKSASVYPIVFLEDKERDEFRPVVLLGLDAGKNLFVANDGKWQASYVPAIIRRYPFALAQTDQEGQFTVCIDEDSSFVSQKDGQALFDKKGEPTEIVENVKRYLSELQQMEVFTKEFCKFLAEHNLYTPLNMRVRDNDKIKNVTGCYVVNEERLNNLSDTLFLEIRKRNYMAPVYSHLTSLAQIERLATLNENESGKAAVKASVESEALSASLQ